MIVDRSASNSCISRARILCNRSFVQHLWTTSCVVLICFFCFCPIYNHTITVFLCGSFAILRRVYRWSIGYTLTFGCSLPLLPYFVRSTILLKMWLKKKNPKRNSFAPYQIIRVCTDCSLYIINAALEIQLYIVYDDMTSVGHTCTRRHVEILMSSIDFLIFFNCWQHNILYRFPWLHDGKW